MNRMKLLRLAAKILLDDSAAFRRIGSKPDLDLDTISSILTEAARRNNLARSLVQLRLDLAPSPGLRAWEKGSKAAAKNWNPQPNKPKG